MPAAGGGPGTHCFIPPLDLPRAYGPAPARGRLRQRIDDFCVDEILGFEPGGEGPHAWLQIRKRDANTRWVAGMLARLAGVPRHAVGFAGLKDRAAVTTQWFSIPVEGRAEPDWSALAAHRLEVLRVVRNRRKLRRGVQKGNRFLIRVRDLEGDPAAIAERVDILRARGAPNYFGAQRFGRDAGNVAGAWDMLCGERRVRDRALRGLYLSAARSLLFNRVLARRVRAATWDRALPGEALMLDGSHSVFPSAAPGTDIVARLERLDLHPTGPLWGVGDPLASDAALAEEHAALTGCDPWCEGLAAAGLEAARRALRVRLGGLEVDFEAPDRIAVSFDLPAGAYATMAIRELTAEPAE